MTTEQRQAMQEALDIAWSNPDGAEFRERLFPEGKPSLETFVARVAVYAHELTNDGDHVATSTWEHT